jgi:hypothetical protein
LGRYTASIRVGRKPSTQLHVGTFDTQAQAALASDLAAICNQGEAAKTNFPIDGYRAELDKRESVWPHNVTPISSDHACNLSTGLCEVDVLSLTLPHNPFT